MISVVCGIAVRTWPARIHTCDDGKEIFTPKLDGMTHTDMEWAYIWDPQEFESLMTRPGDQWPATWTRSMGLKDS